MELTVNRILHFSRVSLLFVRPHAFLGTCIQALVIYQVAYYQMYQPTLEQLILSFFAISFIHVYGMGLNQIFDVEIDRINKPHLPLAAGHLKIKSAWAITLVSAFVAILIASFSGFYLILPIVALGFGLTAYSAPPLRLKKNPWLAALSIALCRSLIFQGGFLWMYSEGKILTQVSFFEILFMAYVFAHSFVFGVSKDVPDVAGDRQFLIKSFASRIGELRLGAISCNSMLILFITFTAFSIGEAYQGLVGLSQLLLGFLVYSMFIRFKKNQIKKTFVNYYMTLWLTFYIQLIVFAWAVSL